MKEMNMMRAAWYTQNGSAKETLVVGEIQKPSVGPGEVLVRIKTSGVNPSDVKNRKNRALIAPQIIPHSDGAGVVEEVGVGVDPARKGERVWIWNAQFGRPHGTACEFVSVSAQQAVKMPDNLDDASAACLGIPGLTAFEAVRLCHDLKDQWVLVTGAGSAVGYYACQLLLLKGAKVIGTVGNQARADLARGVGVQHLIHYKQESIEDRVLEITQGVGVSRIIDLDFSSTKELIPTAAVAHHAQIVCYGSNAIDFSMVFRNLLFKSIELKFFLVYDLEPEAREIAVTGLNDLIRTGKIKHCIAEVFPLEQIVQAHEAVESGLCVGNVVVQIN
jgi:NADPH2:quinone reductase